LWRLTWRSSLPGLIMTFLTNFDRLGNPRLSNLNFLNLPVRTRMPGGVAGARPFMIDPYADYNQTGKIYEQTA